MNGYCAGFLLLCRGGLPLFSFKINNFRICFCSFDLSCSLLKKDNFIEKIYIVLSC